MRRSFASTYDAAGRLQHVDDFRVSGTKRTTFAYDDADRKTSRTLPSGAYTSWTYDNADRLTQVEHKTSSGGSVFARFGYTYDNAGNRLTQSNYDGATTVNQTFVYDRDHRLTSETKDGLLQATYGYDAAGNRTSLVQGATTTTYTPDGDNRLTQVQVNGVTTATFSYDKNGSITARADGAGTTSYAFDGARRLTSVALNGSNQATFTYDGDGARTSKTAGGSMTTYVNDTRGLTQVLQAATGSNTLSFVPGILQHDPAQAGNARWAYFHPDAQHNRVLTDGAAAVGKRWDYEPFGGVRAQSGTAGSDFQYAGEQKDAETGLINLRARYYEPSIGRFLSRDTLSCATRPGFPQTFNRYSYTLNNPVRYVDPSGYIEAGDCTGSNDSECSQYSDDWDDYHGDGDADGDGDVDDWDQDGAWEDWERDNRTPSVGPGPVGGSQEGAGVDADSFTAIVPAGASAADGALYRWEVPQNDTGGGLQCSWEFVCRFRVTWPPQPLCQFEWQCRPSPATPSESNKPDRCDQACDEELGLCLEDAEAEGISLRHSGCFQAHAECLSKRWHGVWKNPPWRRNGAWVRLNC